MSAWIDISMPIKKGIPVWPGDTPFSFHLTWSKASQESVNVGELRLSTHTGTHIDAPYHFDNHGRKAGELPIEPFVGAVLVVELDHPQEITIDHLKDVPLGTERLLVKTGTLTNRCQFPDAIAAVDPNLADKLHDWGVTLLGVDVPSVDPIDSKELPAHFALNRNGIHILEGLVLDHVEPGYYELIAVPLPLMEADASPVRAIIRPMHH